LFPILKKLRIIIKRYFGIEPVISFKKLQKMKATPKYGAARSRSSYSNAAI